MAAKVHEYIPNINEKPHVRIESDKFAHSFLVKPALGGTVMYEVAVTKGSVPAKLSGKYTTIDKAVDAVLKYERIAKDSKAVERDKKVEKRNAAKAARGSQEQLREGADNGEVGANVSV